MATTADFKNGLYFNYEGKPVSIIWFQHVKPGKGPAFVKTKLRNLENGKILDRTFTAGEKIDPINVERRPYTYLYKDDMGYNFMHTETYEQVSIPEEMVENADLMKEGQYVEMMFLANEEKCLTCELPTYVELEVTYTEPAVRATQHPAMPLRPLLWRRERRLWCLCLSIRVIKSVSIPWTEATESV